MEKIHYDYDKILIRGIDVEPIKTYLEVDHFSGFNSTSLPNPDH